MPCATHVILASDEPGNQAAAAAAAAAEAVAAAAAGMALVLGFSVRTAAVAQHG